MPNVLEVNDVIVNKSIAKTIRFAGIAKIVSLPGSLKLLCFTYILQSHYSIDNLFLGMLTARHLCIANINYLLKND